MSPAFWKIQRLVAAALLFTTFTVAGAPALASDDGNDQKIVLGLVLENENRIKRYRDLDTEAMNAATTAFLSTRRFQVIERKELSKIFEEKSLRDVLGTDSQGLFDLLGLDMIGFLSYTVEEKRGELPIYTLSVRLASVSTGEVLGTYDSVRISAITPTSLGIAGDQLAASLRGAFPPEGIVVRVNGPKEVVVDLGSSLGVKANDTLVLFRDAEPIIHPISGEVLPGEEQVIGKLRVKKVNLQTSTCKVASAEGPMEVALRVRYQPRTEKLGRFMPSSMTRVLRGKFAEKSDQ